MILFCIISLIVTSIAALLAQNLLIDVVLMGSFSFIMTLLYLLMNAPDVAITEAAVNSALGTIFTLSTLLVYKHNNVEKLCNRSLLIKLGTITIIICLMFSFTLDFPEFGSPNAPSNNEIANYYIYETISQLGFTNIITGILASFRGFDTLIETAVIFTAANAIYMIVGKNEQN